jgi:hypothetical protein
MKNERRVISLLELCSKNLFSYETNFVSTLSTARIKIKKNTYASLLRFGGWFCVFYVTVVVVINRLT